MTRRRNKNLGKDRELVLTDHLQELRSRILKSVAAILICSVIVYNFIDTILSILIKPVGKLVFIAPTEAFTTSIMIALLGGVFLSLPVVLFQIWRFISAGLKKDERKYALIFGPISFVFFIVGAAFGYLIIIPIGIKFLLGFATASITAMITLSKYISFIGTLTLAFGIVFELPMAMLFLTKLRIVTPKFLSAKRKVAVVLIFIGAATLTPPDVITQCLMAIPLLLLYEIGIIFSKIGYRPI